MPILKYITMNNWTEEEHKISANLMKHQDASECYKELSNLKDSNRFYLIITSEYDDLYLNILTL